MVKSTISADEGVLYQRILSKWYAMTKLYGYDRMTMV